MKMTGLDFLKRFLEHRRLPIILGLAAILLMLPALNTGLMMDDLVQRSVELKPDKSPPRMYETGVPSDSGRLSTVLCDLFGFSRDPRCMTLAKNYGVLAWWVPEDLKAAVWRPFTAFTHWLDYRLFPDAPALMHAHNIAWFAAILFLITITYRKLIDTAWVAGLAAVLFLLDANTYFPVMFVANRGFMMALCFGLSSLHEHHRWRSTRSNVALIFSLLSLALALFSNEAGVSTFAFILSYAFALEQIPFRRRLLTVLPSVLVIIVWRFIYEVLGFGVQNVGMYIDPAHEPLLFAGQLVQRAVILLGGQLASLSPDCLLALNPSLRAMVIAFYGLAFLLASVLFLPLMRRSRLARFWFAAMILAAIPAATVIPLGKNLGFVAVGAFGLIALFIADVLTRQNWVTKSLFGKTLGWVACVLLILVHIPGAIAGRVAAVKIAPFFFDTVTHLSELGDSPNIGNEDVVVVNTPCQLGLIVAPFHRAYRGQTLPKTMRTLIPGCTGYEVKRADDKTLVVEAKGPDVFSCDSVGPIHLGYLFRTFNLLLGEPKFEKGDRRVLSSLTVEVLQVSEQRLPSKIAFRFDTPLHSPGFRWLWFDWQSFSYQPFEVPAIGQSSSLRGPPEVPLSEALRAVFGKADTGSPRTAKN